MTTKIKSGLIADNAIVSAHISSGAISSAHLSSIDTDNVSEGSSNLYFTTARARTSLSVTDSGGDGSLAYDNSTGVITYTGPSAAEVRAHISVTDSGGDGSLAYSNGVITYAGPSASEVQAHLSAGTGVTYSSGAISIGQSVATTASPTFADINITGDLNLTGDINSYSVTDLDIVDQTITLGVGQSESASDGSGIVIAGSSASILWDEPNDEFDFNKGINVTGAITSSGASSFTDLAIGGAADSNYDLKVYGLSRFQGTANFVSSGNVIQVGGQTILDASKNLSNIGTISSGAITSTGILTLDTSPASNGVGDLQIIPSGNATQGVGFAGQVFGVNISSSLSSNSPKQANTWGGVTGATAIALQADDNTYGQFQVWTSPQDSSANTVLTPRFWIAGNGNATFAGTITSGAITSSASITASGNSNNFGDTTISNLSGTSVTTSGSITASGNSNSFGNTTLGTISSGAITSTGTVTVAQNILSASSAPLVLTGDSGANIELYGNGTAFIDATTTSFRGTNGSGTGNISVGLVTSVGGVVNTNTGSNPFYITRQGATNQSLKIYTDDAGAVFESIQDESADNYGNFIFAMDGGTTEPFFDVRKGTASSGSKFRVDGSGNVGIGNDAPAHRLHIQGATTDQARVRVSNSSTGQASLDLNNTEGYFRTYTDGGEYMIYDQTDGEERLRIDTSGNVGIGTTNPAFKLVVSHNGRNGMEFVPNTDDAGTNIIQNYNRGTAAYTPLRIAGNSLTILSGTNAQHSISIDSSGDVGIGTSPVKNSSYSTVLHVHGNSNGSSVRITDSNDGTAALKGLELLHYSNDSYFLNRSNGSAVFFTNNTEKMRIDSSGKVGIGTGSGIANKLTVATAQGTTFSNAFLGLKATDVIDTTGRTGISLATSTVNNYGVTLNGIRHGSTSGEPRFGINMHNNSSGGLEALSIRASGNVGIGVTSPAHKLEVAGNAMLSTTDGFMYLSNVGTGNSGIYVRGIGGSSILRSHSTGQFTWEVNGAEKMRLTSAGQVQATSGVVSSPTFSFIGDTDTGMTRPTSDTLQFITGGIERLRLGNGQMLVNDAATDFNAGKSIVYGGGGTGQNGGTVHYNGPSREYRNVVSVHTAISANRYWHIKTNFFATNNIMFVARVHGYSYGNSGHIVDIQRSGYAYAAHGQLTGSQSVNNGSGADTLEVYFSSDNYVCFRHSTPAAGYYNGYSFDIKMPSPTGYNWNFEVLGHAINSTSGNHY